jgi:capsular polysaccharide biosynthesis protein
MKDLIEHDIVRGYSCERISVIRPSHRDLMITEGDFASFRHLVERVVGTTASPGKRKVFLSRLSRTEKGAYRGLVNETELIEGLVKLGLEIVEPENLTFAEQIRLFSETDALVGLGGAGMFNAVFCQPKTRLISIESSMAFLDAHCNIFGSMDLNYGVIIGEVDSTDERPSQKRWSVDVDMALNAIAEFIG